MNSFSAKNRAQLAGQAASTSFDVLVIGGGITGAGIALDAAARGLKVALIEMQDFASGTSGRSTKLIHGGLRYLKQLEFGLVAEVGKERKTLHRIAPHLARPERMLLPIVKNGSLGKLAARTAIFVYEWIASVKKEERHKVLTKEETLEAEPLLKKDNLLGGILFYEYRTDDARLTIEVMKEAARRGALALNYMEATSFLYQDGSITGVVARDRINNGEYVIQAKYVINAGGPWVDSITGLDEKRNEHKLQITKGIHLVFDGEKLPVKQSAYFDTYDGRMLFVIPREGKTYAGTTDTFYKGDLVHPDISREDRDYVLRCVNDYFPGVRLRPSDIESGWAGLRPLVNKPGKGPSEISRKDEIFASASGLITIAGGKLTGYRKMAERVVNLVSEKIRAAEGKIIPGCATENIPLGGSEIISDRDFSEFVRHQIAKGMELGLTSDEATRLVYRYGANVNEIFNILVTQVKNKNHELPKILLAELIYCVENEMCVTLSDFLIRRTGNLYFDIKCVEKWKEALAIQMQNMMEWREGQMAAFTRELEDALEEFERLKKQGTLSA